MSDHVIHAPPSLARYPSVLFTALICHGHAAECLRDSIIQPIPKSDKDFTKSTNYQGIAFASCLSKVLELCILISFLIHPVLDLRKDFLMNYAVLVKIGLF